MRFLIVASFLALCGTVLTAPSYHHDEDHDIKYVLVTKHEAAAASGWEAKDSDVNVNVGYEIVAAKHSGYDEQHKDEDKDVKYEFYYGVKDLKTGDIKNQWEARNGDKVKGTYSLVEADGTTRLVEYSADDHNGFNAVVKKIGQAEHTVAHAQKSDQAAKWEGDLKYEGHDHEEPATSYVNVKHH